MTHEPPGLPRWPLEPVDCRLRSLTRPDEDEPTRLLIQIEYRVRATNNRFNLVYPFYLE